MGRIGTSLPSTGFPRGYSSSTPSGSAVGNHGSPSVPWTFLWATHRRITRPDSALIKNPRHQKRVVATRLVFVEVKVEGDRVSRTQRKMMRRIAKYFGKDRHVQIFVYHVRAGVRKRIATRSQSHKEVERKLREGKVMSSQLFLAA